MTSASNVKYIREEHQGIATLLAFALLPLSGFATDIYIPSLPDMSAALGTSNIQVQLTLTFFLISYGVSQPFIGTVLDSFGRYRISLISLLIFALSCVVIALTQNIYLIYAMRIVHGFAVGAIVVAKRAYFVDLFTGARLKHYLSLFSIIWSTGPIIAPFLGGYLQTAFGWQSNFYFLAVFATVLALLEFLYSGETLRHYTNFHLRSIAATYTGMLKTASFSLGIVMLGLAYCMVMIYNMTGPFVIEHHLNLSPVTAGYSSLILGFAWMTGGFISKATIERPFLKRMASNLTVQILFTGAMLLCMHLAESLYTMLAFAFLIHAGAGYTFNNYFTFCLGMFPKNAGTAGGLTGGLNYVIVSFLSYVLIFFIPAKDGNNLALSYLTLVILSILVMILIFRLGKSKTDR